MRTYKLLTFSPQEEMQLLSKLSHSVTVFGHFSVGRLGNDLDRVF